MSSKDSLDKARIEDIIAGLESQATKPADPVVQSAPPTPEKPPVEQAPVEQAPPAVEPPAFQPPVEQAPPAVEPPAFQPPVEQAPVEQAPFAEPPAFQPPVEQPPVEQAPFAEPPAFQPQVEQPPVEQAPFAEPPAFQPQVEQPPVEQAPFAPPAVEPPAFQPPVEQPPVEQFPPAVEPPAFQPQVEQPPVEQFPPAVEPPAFQPQQSEVSQGFSPEPPASISIPEEKPVSSGSLSAVGDPRDILLAIAIVDHEAEQAHEAQETVNAIRQQALEASGPKKKGGAFPAKALPFGQLEQGDPPIATIYSPKGGVGKSSTAMNLAMYIAAIGQAMAAKDQKRSKGPVRVPRVLLLDGDIAHGCLGLRMTGKMDPSIGDLHDYVYDRRDSGFTGETAWPQSYDQPVPGEKGMLNFVTWPPDLPNLNLLSSPKDPDDFFAFGPREYNEILRLLRTFYDVIIIDAGTDVIQDSQRAWIQHAHQVFMVTTPEIDSLYNSARAARYMAKPRPHPRDDSENPEILAPLIGGDDLSLVITKADVDSGLPLDQLIKTKLFPWMRKDQIFRVPDFQNEMMRANNSSDFLVRQNADYAKVISAMARYLFDQALATKRQRQLPEAPAQAVAAVAQ